MLYHGAHRATQPDENGLSDHKQAYYNHTAMPEPHRRVSPLLSCLLFGGAVVILAGCTLGPNFLRPKPPSETGYRKDTNPTLSAGAQDQSQRIVAGEGLPEDWWALFRSPEIDATVRQAIAGNRTLVQAQATLRQALQVEVQAGGKQYPQLNVAAGVERQRLDFAALGIPPGPGFPRFREFNLFSVGPTVSYSVDIWGGERRFIEERHAQAEFQAYEMAAAYLSITGNAVTQAVLIASFRAQLAAVDDILASDEQNLRLVKRQLQAGEGTQIEVESAQSQLENDRTLAPPLRQQLSAARNALSLLVGRSPAAWSPPDFDLDRIALPADLPVSLPAELVRRRPDILAAESQVHASSAAVGVATAALYPQITLSAAFEQLSTSAGNWFAVYNNAWNIAGNLTAPILHGGELTAQKRAAIASFDASVAGYEQTVLTAFTQVATLLDALQHDAELIDAQRRALDTAQRSLKLTRSSYSGGNVGILFVLDAQRRYQQARLGYVRAVQQRYLDTVQLFAAMGGGWRQWQAAQMPQPPQDQNQETIQRLFSP
jgi:NodT family efflux transporter outer membrane factor (OMF) lipoprotein